MLDELLDTRWHNLIVGTYITHTDKGFINVFLNNELIFDYKGSTYGWTKVGGSHVRIGIYRNRINSPQTIYYDDFVIGNKDDVIKVLWK